ncbi:hypothetical protein ABZ403_02100 [Micromonospora zamorensis]|uniref:hypothetical protein n=1 Tax=Micromonospora zamorensis TaxID=709883 RepID=UPI0033DD0FBD
MSRSLARGLLRGTLTLALVTSTTVLGSAVAHAATPRLALTALSFEQSTVDATQDNGSNRLTFTATNTEPDAQNLAGTVTLRMRSSLTGEWLGHDRVVRFDYNYGWGDVELVSGTPREATFAYHMPVRRYSDATTATWEVTKVTLSGDDISATVGAAKLSTFPGYRFTATTLIDLSAPTFSFLALNNGRDPYFYVKDDPAYFAISLTVDDYQSGFWKGSIKLVGPGGQSLSTQIDWARDEYSTGFRCGGSTSGDADGHYVPCSMEMKFPPGTAPGSWRVGQIVLVNNAGGRATYKNPAGPSMVVTSNSTLQATDFVVSPNPVDNWRADVTTELSMAVTGAVRGISQLDVTFEDQCSTTGQPYTKADGRLAVRVLVSSRARGCEVEKLSVRDGAGNLALYGAEASAPDPQISIDQVPSTEPPTALSAALNPASIPLSQLANQSIRLTVQAEVKVAPVTSMPVYVYDADGEVVFQTSGYGGQAPDGSLTYDMSLGYWGLEPGQYTVGFMLYDASGLRSYWNMPDVSSSLTLPGGPVVLTITEG